MITLLALRNLLHDRARLIITVLGMLVSVVLIAGQLALYRGSADLITAPITRSSAELWVMARNTASFEDGVPLPSGRERQIILAVAGVQSVSELFVAFADWIKPQGGSNNVLVIGTNSDANGLTPWNLESAGPDGAVVAGGVAIDRTYAEELGIGAIGETAQIEQSAVRIGSFTRNVRSFTQTPFVFMPLRRAREAFGAESDTATYLLVKLSNGQNVEAVRKDIASRLPNVDVLTTAEFKDRSLETWLFNTGAGLSLIGGAILGLIVGTVIVAQTLYSSIKDHVKEYATLRAIGASSRYMRSVVLMQAMTSSVAGYSIGMIIVLLLARASEGSAVTLKVGFELSIYVLLLSLMMSTVAALAAIWKVLQIDPSTVFSR